MTELAKPQDSSAGLETSGTEVSAGPENPARRKFLQAAGLGLLALATLKSHEVIQIGAGIGVEVFDPDSKKTITVSVNAVNAENFGVAALPQDVRRRMYNIDSMIEGKRTEVKVGIGESRVIIYQGGLENANKKRGQGPLAALPAISIYSGVAVKSTPYGPLSK